MSEKICMISRNFWPIDAHELCGVREYVGNLYYYMSGFCNTVTLWKNAIIAHFRLGNFFLRVKI